MKTAKYSLCLLSLLAGLATAAAGDGAKSPPPAKSTPPKDGKSAVQTEKDVQLTGSYIKRTVIRNGQITDGPYQVVVIDQKAIANSGASSLKQLLVRQGVGR